MILRWTLLAAAATIGGWLKVVEGAALTTAIPPNQKMCFYADVDKQGEKIGVRILLLFCFVNSRAFVYCIFF
jgi:hypothetical protein